MKELIVSTAIRKARRDIKNPLANDFIKYLAEILINSDDSYKRIEETDTNKAIRTIDIVVDRNKELVTVIDRAEGMDQSELERIFTEYGADNAGGDKFSMVRGLFGQGASDVLFSCSMSRKIAKIESIKNNQFSICKFIYRDQKKITLETPKADLPALRKKYDIPSNGTIVTFGIPNEVKLPKKNDLQQKIETFYMFRYLLSNPHRNVFLEDDGLRVLLSSQKYELRSHKNLVKNKKIVFTYEKFKVEGVLNLYENPNKSIDGTHVIIKDDRDAVYDNTLFDLERFPGAHLISGELLISNLYSILKAKLEDEEYPLQILTDSRDGFDRRTEFTKTLFSVVTPIIDKAIKTNNEKKSTSSISLEQLQKFKDALKKINDYFKERIASEIGALSPGIEPPANGIEFARGSISITENKRYVLLLFINANLVSDSQTISIFAEQNLFFSYFPETIRFSRKEANEKGLITKYITLEGRQPSENIISITAKVEKFEAEAFVRVVKEIVIYPKFGFEFIPDNYVFQTGKESTLKLFFDPGKFPVGTTVELAINSKEELLPDIRNYIITEECLIQEKTGLIQIPFVGSKSDTSYSVIASSLHSVTQAHIRVKDKTEDETGKSGFLSRLQLVFYPDEKWQSSLRENDGTLFINGAHPINKAMMGDLNALDKKKPDFKSIQLRYIFELISAESARRVAKSEFADSDLSSVSRVLDFIQTEKTILYCYLLPETE